MIDFSNIKEYSTDYPDVPTFLGTPEEANQLSNEHKSQIHFLDEAGTKLVQDYLHWSRMYAEINPSNFGPESWSPFKPSYFKTVENIEVTLDSEDEITKWLYKRGIPFSNYVFIAQVSSRQSVMLTWKMVLKNWESILNSQGAEIFDQTLNWGLFIFKYNLYFGKDKVFSNDDETKKMLELNELKKKHPFLKLPY
jgi:hypothetical protein